MLPLISLEISSEAALSETENHHKMSQYPDTNCTMSQVRLLSAGLN